MCTADKVQSRLATTLRAMFGGQAKNFSVVARSEGNATPVQAGNFSPMGGLYASAVGGAGATPQGQPQPGVAGANVAPAALFNKPLTFWNKSGGRVPGAETSVT